LSNKYLEKLYEKCLGKKNTSGVVSPSENGRSFSKYLKISVDVSATERYLKLPKIDTMYYLDLVEESSMGINEYNQIMELKKIR